MTPSQFQTAFAAWLGRVCFAERPPESVVAYNIGLFQTPDGFSAYLVGADRYNEDDNDWACQESFTPKERYLPIPAGAFEGWEQVRAAAVEATRKFLNSDAGERSFLATAKAITVGFDNGDLERVK